MTFKANYQKFSKPESAVRLPEMYWAEDSREMGTEELHHLEPGLGGGKTAPLSGFPLSPLNLYLNPSAALSFSFFSFFLFFIVRMMRSNIKKQLLSIYYFLL